MTPTVALDGEALADLARFARHGNTPGITKQLAKLAGCINPIRLTGTRTDVDTITGEVLRTFTSRDLASGHLLVRCGNRRTTRCPACAETYRRDTYHLITAGLVGGKTVPDTVTAHPRVFLTLTAPSFGPVHNRPTATGGRCRCGTHHRTDDAALGTPLDPRTYDYAAAVLWNAYAGRIWADFTMHLRRALAAAAGLPQRDLPQVARLSFAKVAEYQKRGAVHFHAVIRIDGRTPGTDNVTAPPAWATPELLDAAIRDAARRTRVPGPGGDLPDRFAWGTQLDIRPIHGDALATGALTDRAVAGYIAKYATKGAEAATGTLDRRLRTLSDLDGMDVPEHARRLITAAWTLGERPGLAELGLQRWAHMLGFRGHFSTKSRRYSTTLGALRDARAAWNDAKHRAAAERAGHPLPDPETTLIVQTWAYTGSGLSPGERWLARGTTPDPDTARDALNELRHQEGDTE